jgi:hypothetical protein
MQTARCRTCKTFRPRSQFPFIIGRGIQTIRCSACDAKRVRKVQTRTEASQVHANNLAKAYGRALGALRDKHPKAFKTLRKELAYTAALRTLRDRYPGEFKALYEEQKQLCSS